MPRDFIKTAKSFAEQVELLRSRGMIIDDEQEAVFYLQHLNYYRLSAYWLPFEADHTTHQFKPDTRFNDVLRLYIFDRELRLLILDGIERIEVSVRSQWAYQLATSYTPHAHLNPELFNSRYLQNLTDLKKEVNRSKEDFIIHLQNTYDEELLPIWAVCEVMSFGLLSRWYNSLKIKKVRSAIAKVYKIDDTVLGSWLHHLSMVRKFCAHHSRLWNREHPIKPALPRSKKNKIASHLVSQSGKTYRTHLISKLLLVV